MHMSVDELKMLGGQRATHLAKKLIASISGNSHIPHLRRFER